MITYATVCTGIEGMGLGANWLGWKPIFQVEIDPFCQSVLQRNYPAVPKYNDLTTFNAKPYRNTADVIFGGFPCQPYSNAGNRLGDNDPRAIRKSFIRVIRELNPKIVVAENVLGIVSISEGMVFEDFCLDLENEGYEVQPVNLPAASIGACHQRERIFFIAKNTHRYLNGGSPSGWNSGLHRNPCPAVYVRNATHTYHPRNRTEPQHLRKKEKSLRRVERQETDNLYKYDCYAESTDNAFTVGSDCESAGLPCCAVRPKQIQPRRNHSRRNDLQENWYQIAARVHRVDDDLPSWLDIARLRMDISRMCPAATEAQIQKAIKATIGKIREERLKACGNGVVAELSRMLCKAIEKII